MRKTLRNMLDKCNLSAVWCPVGQNSWPFSSPQGPQKLSNQACRMLKKDSASKPGHKIRHNLHASSSTLRESTITRFGHTGFQFSHPHDAHQDPWQSAPGKAEVLRSPFKILLPPVCYDLPFFTSRVLFVVLFELESGTHDNPASPPKVSMDKKQKARATAAYAAEHGVTIAQAIRICKSRRVCSDGMVRRAANGTLSNRPAGPPPLLTEEEESCLADSITRAMLEGHCATSSEVRNAVKHYLDSQGRNIPQWKNNLPGPEWLRVFKSRWNMDTRRSRACPLSRHQVKKQDMDDFFKRLHQTMQEHNIPDSQVWNMDETAAEMDATHAQTVRPAPLSLCPAAGGHRPLTEAPSYPSLCCR